jgi:tetraacyldisaccharide 4'-kinase
MKFLEPLSLIYSFLNDLNKKITKSKRLSKPTISVGNIAWGGTGKTPIVIEIAKFVAANGKKPAILTRGYGRKSKMPLLLQSGASAAKVEDYGDEALLISKKVALSSVVVGANRYENAFKFENTAKPDIYILDDGFQHYNIQRDLDIVCINGANPFGNEMLIPAGSLREKPAKALKRADLIIITNADMSNNLETIKKDIFNWTGQEALISYYGNFEYKRLNLKENFDSNLLKGQNNVLLSAIGFAKGFKHSVEKSGIEVKKTFTLKDHSFYNLKEIKKILSSIDKNAYLIITEKDAVKVEQIADEEIQNRIAVLVVQPIFSREDYKQWQEKLLKILQSF